MPQTTYRSEILDDLLGLIWSQWTTMGVSGNVPVVNRWIIDPEALVVFTCDVGRYDPRVFDGMLEWISIHQRLVNVSRLKTLTSELGLSDGRILPAIADLLTKPSSRSKWNGLAKNIPVGEVRQEPLFYLKDGRSHPDPVKPDPHFDRAGFSRSKYTDRNSVMQFPPNRPANLLLKLRALFGVNARCETIAYLATHSEANPTETASAIGYSQKAVFNVMNELSHSGAVTKRVRGRETLYSLRRNCWNKLLWAGSAEAQWLGWREVFSFLLKTWAAFDDARIQSNLDSSLLHEITLLIRRDAQSLPQQIIAPLEIVLAGSAEAAADMRTTCEALRKFIQELR